MTPNNLHGHHKNIKWDILYQEELDKRWNLVITLSKEYSTEFFPHVCVQCVVTTKKLHTWGNGVQSFIEHDIEDHVSDTVKPLIFNTKDGFTCEQFIASRNELEKTVRMDWKTNITPEYILSKLN